ncbi:SHOCT domain-containing protein [Alistipes indistinctus]|nr:SHOCT domain-containing protein [Alistipes indistinctus]
MAFLWSILLSPLIGVIITMASKPLEDAEMEKQQLELQKEQMKELKNIASKNSVQQIKEAKELLDSGAITEDEFSILKKQIIGDLPKPIIPSSQQKIIVDEPDAVVDTDTSESSNKNTIMLGIFLIIIVFALFFGVIGALAIQ